jgi:hypothetical protein
MEQLDGLLYSVPAYKVERVKVNSKGMVEVTIETDCKTLDHK